MEFAELKKHLKTQPPKPCYFCYGDDEYVISRAVALIKALAEEPSAFNVADKEFGSANELTEELFQLPLTGERRVVVARGKIDLSAVENYLKAPNPSSVLVLVNYIPHDSWNRTAAPAVPDGATPVNCNRQSEALLVRYVASVFAKTGATADERTIRLLCSRCDGYMTRINSEAKKLSLLCAGGTVTAETVNREVKADTEFVVYELTDSIVDHDAARALAIVDGMAKNNDLGAAFTLLYNRFKKMFSAAVDPNGLAAQGVKPYMLKKLKEEAARFSKVKLKRDLDRLAAADYGYKTGATTQYEALCSFVVQAASEV